MHTQQLSIGLRSVEVQACKNIGKESSVNFGCVISHSYFDSLGKVEILCYVLLMIQFYSIYKRTPI